MVNLWWVWLILISIAILAISSWLGLGLWWWLTKKSRHRTILVAPLERKLEEKATTLNAEIISSTHKAIIVHSENAALTVNTNVTTEKILVFPTNIENLMWRPPPRESLLHRQQIKIKLNKPADRAKPSELIEGIRARPNPLPLFSTLPPFPKAPLPKLETKSETHNNFSDTMKNNLIMPLDPKIGRQRQGLESLVTPIEANTNNNNDNNANKDNNNEDQSKLINNTEGANAHNNTDNITTHNNNNNKTE